jgi:hypothetical protein
VSMDGLYLWTFCRKGVLYVEKDVFILVPCRH